MVKQILWAVLFLNTFLLQAQTFEKAVFTHKVTRETRTLKVGDRLKVTYKEKDDWTAVKGRLQGVDNEKLFLQGKPGIPLYSIDTIRYRDPGLRRVIGIMLAVSLVLLCIGSVLVLASIASVPAYNALPYFLVSGYALAIATWIVLAVNTHRIRNTGAEWDVVIVETLKQQVP
ncbi:MAG: hypothetical protein IT270_19560 [Saprospiraceae bacterium]|nr:hypothetical protein [Saprospiraceae bacterium]